MTDRVVFSSADLIKGLNSELQKFILQVEDLEWCASIHSEAIIISAL